MALYYLPVLIRSDRYFVTRLEQDSRRKQESVDDFNFVVHAADRVFTPLLTIEDPARIALNQMAPCERQDVPLKECHISLQKTGNGFRLLIKKSTTFVVEKMEDEETGLRLDYSAEQRRITVGYYKYKVEQYPLQLELVFEHNPGETYTGFLQFTIVRSVDCQRIVIDFGSEASQIGYKNCGPQSSIVPYDILENIISQLKLSNPEKNWKRDNLLKYQMSQQML